MTTVKQKTTENKEVREQGYDEVPYTSYPFHFTRPENLHALSKLFDVKTPDIEKARVLELGGSDGMNFVRFASEYPESYCLGVDLSSVEIEHGQKFIKQLGLKNYDLKHMSITDLDLNGEKFDYIICHGVYSWVPEFVRESILEVCKKLLTPNGVALVSYNTLPGWNMISTIRELMQFHAANFQSTNDKIQQSKLALDFIAESLKESDTPYAMFLKQHLEIIKLKKDEYLRHEYLADENKAFYFSDFIESARKHGLTYLADSDVQKMYIGNFPEKVLQKLNQIQDIVRTEQYVDFIRNTQFRCTVLCHDNVKIDRNITNDRLSSMFFSTSIDCAQELTDEIIKSDKNVSFHLSENKDSVVGTKSFAVKALLAIFVDNKNVVYSVDEIIDETHKRFGELDKETIRGEFFSIVGKLVFSAYVSFYSSRPKAIQKISEKPKISDVNLLRFKHYPADVDVWLINEVNALVPLENTYRFIIPLLDGTRTKEDILDKIVEFAKAGALTVKIEDKSVDEESELRKLCSLFVDQSIEKLKLSNCLVA